MAILTNGGEIRIFIRQCLYFGKRFLYMAIQWMLHRFNGVAAHRRKIADSSTNQVAEVFTVKGRLPHLGMAISDHYQLNLWHEKFVTIGYLLRPDVTLYFFDDTVAMFLERPNSRELYNTEKFPFFFMGQQQTCERAIILPLNKLKELSELVGDRKCEVTWILHTGRCCSTALAQAFNPIPNWMVLAETYFLHKHLAAECKRRGLLFDNYLTSEQFFFVTAAAINFMLKDFDANTKVLWKAPAILDFCTIPLLASEFPDDKVITLHRDGLGTCKSFYLANSDNTFLNTAILAINYRLSRSIFAPICDPILFIYTGGMFTKYAEYFQTEKFDVFKIFYVRWLTNMVQFLKYSDAIKNLRCYIYDDIRNENQKTITEVYEYLDISKEYLPLSLEALNNDSQKGTIMDRGKMAQKAVWQRDPSTVMACENLLAKHALPPFDQKFRFDENRKIQLL